MSDSFAQDLAQCERGLVIAPAGFGKTHLITEAVGACEGTQLILTHTHAGVKAISDRMKRQKVPSSKYCLSTFDSFALRFATAYPSISGWTQRTPEGKQWEELRPSAVKVFRASAIQEVMAATYSGVFVDEYQDCCRQQHDIALALAEVLPCRILGDPLQAVFQEINKAAAIPWIQVQEDFAKVAELQVPYRWKGKAERLGEWLREIRPELEKGGEINLGGGPRNELRFYCPDKSMTLPELQRKQCYSLLRDDGSHLALYAQRRQCHDMAGKLKGNFRTYEDAECRDLLDAASSIDASAGAARVRTILKIVKEWLANVASLQELEGLMKCVARGTQTRSKKPHLQSLLPVLENVARIQSYSTVYEALKTFDTHFVEGVIKSAEVWRGLQKAALAAASGEYETMRQAAWAHRSQLRHAGRKPPPNCLSTHLIVKGLEFDHVLVLNASDFLTPEALYVCLSRGSRTVRVIGADPKLKLKRAAHCMRKVACTAEVQCNLFD